MQKFYVLNCMHPALLIPLSKPDKWLPIRRDRGTTLLSRHKGNVGYISTTSGGIHAAHLTQLHSALLWKILHHFSHLYLFGSHFLLLLPPSHHFHGFAPTWRAALLQLLAALLEVLALAPRWITHNGPREGDIQLPSSHFLHLTSGSGTDTALVGIPACRIRPSRGISSSTIVVDTKAPAWCRCWH